MFALGYGRHKGECDEPVEQDCEVCQQHRPTESLTDRNEDGADECEQNYDSRSRPPVVVR